MQAWLGYLLYSSYSFCRCLCYNPVVLHGSLDAEAVLQGDTHGVVASKMALGMLVPMSLGSTADHRPAEWLSMVVLPITIQLFV